MAKPTSASKLPMVSPDSQTGLLGWLPDLLAIAGLVVAIAIVVSAVV
jgi:hypothetical protein